VDGHWNHERKDADLFADLHFSNQSKAHSTTALQIFIATRLANLNSKKQTRVKENESISLAFVDRVHNTGRPQKKRHGSGDRIKMKKSR
jgi:hypothetical protein